MKKVKGLRSKVKMVTGTYRIGDIAYERPADPVGADVPSARWAELKARDAADCARQAEMCEWFEDLADRANAEG